MTNEKVLQLIREAAENNLTQLNLSGNRLIQLPPEISKLQNLTQLDLSGNKLTQLPPQITELQNLTQLNLSFNELTQLPLQITELQNLTQLDLSGNQLTQLPPQITKLQNLTQLNLSNRHVKSSSETMGLTMLKNIIVIPDEFKQILLQFTKLQKVMSIFPRNKFAELPPQIAKLQNLTQLDLSGNQLTQLPPQITELQNLTQLDLSGNQLTQLPPQITELQNLTQLDLSGNQLTQLPPQITKLQNLTQLNLSFNELTQLPPQITELQNLTQLDLSGNQLTQLPIEINKLQNLTQLNLFLNKLVQLPLEIGELKNLTQLDLSQNQLTQLPSQITELQNLTQLELSGNKFVELPSQITKLQNLTQLNLSLNELTQLPPQITKLQNLTQLNLSQNQLTKLPSQITELQNLTQLNLSFNELTQLPLQITELQNLTQLDLSGNQLTKLPIEITELQNLTQLNLSQNQLTHIPIEITKLQNLTQLNLSQNQLTKLPPQITKLQNLTQLNLSQNQLAQLPMEITKLQNLTQLNLSQNQLAQLPIEITKLQNLTQLNLSQNQLAQLPIEITELQNLTQLYLSQNQLVQLPIEITKLQNLTQLNLSQNQLVQLPIEITKLQNLTQLNLSQNQLAQLPIEITKLQNLTQLYLSQNQLTKLPPQITELQNLTQLDLSGNKFAEFPSQITKLQNLTQLYLSQNQLTKLPPQITELQNLTQLDLSGNKFIELPLQITELQNLTQLKLSQNQLTHIPMEITKLQNLFILFLDNNPLKSPPPEIASGGIKAIYTYLNQVDFEEQNEAKLILVGNGDVGKTCLANRLIHRKFIKDKKTEGINISGWTIDAPIPIKDKIKLNVWDFGGQEIYHATHQFFLTKRSVYILVWNARKVKDYDHIFYWLHTVGAFAGDSPLILVMTKLKEHNDDLNLQDIKEKYEIIKDSMKVDSNDGIGCLELEHKISEIAWNLPQMQVPWPKTWINVRKKLEFLNSNWITNDEFCSICKSEGLDDKSIEVLDYYLHNLGVILHFRDRLELKNMIILKPEWATNAVYKILSRNSVSGRGGILLHSELDEIWNINEYPKDTHSKLLELMNKFELAYELPDKKSHLVSELLPENMPEFLWNEKDNLCFIYSYDFLPAGVMTRFIVRVHENLEKRSNGTPLCGRDGALLILDNTRALIKVRFYEKEIEVKIAGEQKRRLLEIISYEFDEINKQFDKINVIKKIPCNCSDKCSYYFDYSRLLEAEKKGISKVQCQINWKDVSLPSLLSGYKIGRDMLDDQMSEEEKSRVIHFSPTFNLHQQQSQSMENQQITTTNISINIKVDFPMLQADFDNLLEEIKNINPRMSEELEKIQDTMDEVSSDSEKEKFIKPLNKLSRFLQKLGDPDSEYNKLVSGTQKGIEYAQKLGKTYNKLAPWLALPSVPDLFVGK